MHQLVLARVKKTRLASALHGNDTVHGSKMEHILGSGSYYHGEYYLEKNLRIFLAL